MQPTLPRESTESTKANADEDIEYQNDPSGVPAAGDANTKDKATVIDEHIASVTSGVGCWVNQGQES